MAEVGLLAVACAYGLISGFNDGGNLLASFTAGRAITPRFAAALLLLSCVGPLLVGTQVARTVGSNVIDLAAQGRLGFVLITSASLAVVLASWRLRLPTSMTLALVGAMLGWVLGGAHSSQIHWSGVARVLVGMPVSVLAGFLSAFGLYRLTRRLLGSVPHARALSLARSQYLTGALQAIAYGSNDMEKTIGLVAVAGLASGGDADLRFNGWLPLGLAFATFVVGAILGGWRIARRVGSGVFRVRPVQAMSEQFGAGVVVAGLAFAGAPVSSTQTIGGSLVGVGVGVRAASVRWGLVRDMLASWIVTLPLAVAAAATVHLVLRAGGIR